MNINEARWVTEIQMCIDNLNMQITQWSTDQLSEPSLLYICFVAPVKLKQHIFLAAQLQLE